MRINPKLLNLIVLFVIGILAFWSYITEETNYGRVYTAAFFLTLFGILASYTPEIKKVFQYSPANDTHIIWQGLAGLGLGLVLTSTVWMGLSILSPLSVPTAVNVLGVLGVGAFALVFIMAISVCEFEEGLRAAFLKPSIQEWLQYNNLVSVLLVLAGIIIYFVLQNDFLRIIGVMLGIGGILNFYWKGGLADWLSDSDFWRNVIAGLFAAVFFMLLHYTAYGSIDPAITTALMLNAFLYAFIADMLNSLFKGEEDEQSTIPSRTAHTFNNATVTCLAAGVPVLFAFFVTGAHYALMYVATHERD